MRKVIYVSIFLASIYLFISIIYNNYYKIDMSSINYLYVIRYDYSPDDKYMLCTDVLREEEDSDNSYIHCILVNTNVRNSSETIFWQKVDSDEVRNIFFNGVQLNNWVDVEWIDSKTVVINDIKVNIHKGYDYRRDFS